jgi:pyruvate ferredoxin oxidoreductase gamma subunit
VPNVPLLGAFAALGGLISLAAVEAAIQQKFKGTVAQGNMAAAREAYEIVMEQEKSAQEIQHA